MFILETHIVQKEEQDCRIYDYCCGLFEQLPSRKSVKKAIKSGAILLNNETVESGRFVQLNDKIELFDLDEKLPKSYILDFEIIYEDDYFAVINKPAGIPVSGNQFKTIQNALLGKVSISSQKDALKLPRPVHRLDAPTQGLLIIAKTTNALMGFGNLFENRLILKEYQAVVVGKTPSKGIIDKDLESKKAVTKFETLETTHSIKNEFLSLLKLQPKTGRTHQIRKHLLSINHSIVGDTIYGEKGNTLLHKGLFLAATQLSFKHPITQLETTISITTPLKFTKLIERENTMWKKKFKL